VSYRQDLQLMAQIARLYYEKRLTQQEIADQLNLSRQKVSRMILRAREEGIVRITILDPIPTNCDLEREFQEVTGLHHVMLVAGEGLEEETLRRRIGLAGAEFISRKIVDGQEVGIGWGRTLTALVQAFPKVPKKEISVIPLMGGIGELTPAFQVNELARQLAEALGGTYRFFHLPAFTNDQEAWEILMRTMEADSISKHWARVNPAIVGIGHVGIQHASKMFFGEYIHPVHLAQLEARGAVGDICGRFYDINGNPVIVGAGVIGIGIADLAAVPEVIAVAGGLEKTSAIIGALKGGYISTLISDTATARAVLRDFYDKM
jgi:DNA-binding transcriptional regulator LsrR (DeoR family)